MSLLDTWKTRFRESFGEQTLLERRQVEIFLGIEINMAGAQAREAELKLHVHRLNKMLETNLEHVYQVIDGCEEPLTRESVKATIKRCLT